MVKWIICGAILATALLLIKLRNLYRREKRLLRNDAKTGALTERGFIEALQDESKRSRRHLRPLTLVYVDLDNFSAVNGILGYDAGDAALKVVARTMRSTLREVDVVARRQGDEFVLLLPETGPEGVTLVLTKLQEALREAMIANRWPVTTSVGAVTFLQPLDPVEAMITACSNVMFSAAKHNGKDRFQHVEFEKRAQPDNLIACPKCNASFVATDHACCPTCGNAALANSAPEPEAIGSKLPWIASDSSGTGKCAFRLVLDNEKTIEFYGHADITEQKVDAVVSAGNSRLTGTGGVDEAIFKGAGSLILTECQQIVASKGRLSSGKAVMTTGGNLPAKHVIHTIGPYYVEGRRGESETLANCYRECIRLGEAHAIRSLAFPSISTGPHRRYPVGEAARIAVFTVAKALRSTKHVNLVRFVLLDVATLKAYIAAGEEFEALNARASTPDPLTGLNNRCSLFAELDSLLKKPDRRFALMIIDMDRFKRVNDEYGHKIGDDVLRAVAQLLSKRADAYRCGSDEFAVIVLSAEASGASILAESVRAEVADLTFKECPEANFTISVGMAMSPEDGSTAEELMRYADASMHNAKCDGGNCVRTCSEVSAKRA